MDIIDSFSYFLIISAIVLIIMFYRQVIILLLRNRPTKKMSRLAEKSRNRLMVDIGNIENMNDNNVEPDFLKKSNI